MKDFFKNKKILITGHTGFKGAWLAHILTNWGAQVIGVSLPAHTDPSLFTILGIGDRTRGYFADIRNFVELEAIFKRERPEIVFHLAAQALVRESYDRPLNTYETNVLGTANVLQCIRNVDSVFSAVIITTDKVYENTGRYDPYKEDDRLGGFDPYSASKAAADIVTQSYIQSFFNPQKYKDGHHTLIAIARAGNVIGGGDWGKDRLIPDAVKAIYGGSGDIIIRNPQAIRPWQHVLEPLSGYMLLAKKLYDGETELSGAWNFGPKNGEDHPVSEVIKKVTDCLGGKCVVVPDGSKHEAAVLRLDIAKAKNVLGWMPVLSWDDSMAHTLEWYKEFYENRGEILNKTNQQIEGFFNLI